MNILLEKIFKLNRIKKIIIQIITDIILITFCFILSITIRLNNLKFINQLEYWKVLLIVVFTTIFIYFTLGFYKSIIRYISEKIFLSVGVAVFFSSTTLYVSSIFFDALIPRSVPFIYFSFLFLSTAGIRFIFKNIYLIYKFDKRKPIAIYGAGNTGRQISDYLNESLEYKPIFFIDDNKKLFKTKINELNVYNVNNFENHALKNNIRTIILAMPNLSLKNRQIIIKKLENKNLEVKTITDNNSLIFSKKKILIFPIYQFKKLLEGKKFLL